MSKQQAQMQLFFNTLPVTYAHPCTKKEKMKNSVVSLLRTSALDKIVDIAKYGVILHLSVLLCGVCMILPYILLVLYCF